MKTSLQSKIVPAGIITIIVLLIFVGAIIGSHEITMDEQLSSSPTPSLANSPSTLPPTATERQLTSDFRDINAISWSSDGEKIVYSDVKNIAIVNLHRDVLGKFDGRSPVWSPHEQTIAFISSFGSPENREGIVLFNTNNNRVTRLTDQNLFAFSPSWNSDGEKLIFTMGKDPNDASVPFQIWTMDRNGNGKKQLTIDYYPKSSLGFSPDGSKILYSISVQDTSYAYHNELWIMDANGGKQQFLEIYEPRAVAWSPDGSRILVKGSDRKDKAGILILNSDGTDVQKVTDGEDPNWSPDGSKIAYEYKDDIWMMDSDGTNKVQLTEGKDGDGIPVWSPDGKKIAFSRNNGDTLFTDESLWLLEF